VQASPEATAVAVKPPGRDRTNRRLNLGGHAPPAGGFGKLWRRIPNRRLSDAEHDALFAEYVACGQAARDHEYVASGQADRDARAYRVKRERARLAVATHRRPSRTARARERRDSCGRSSARSGDSGSGDPGPSDSAAPATGNSRRA
jgi:hypothetical protein